jgi:hypothetical protein
VWKGPDMALANNMIKEQQCDSQDHMKSNQC